MSKAVIIFSGGQDSTTVLGWALNRFDSVECISFNYGQKHSIELEQARLICLKHQIRQTVIDISFLDTLVDSALTSKGDVNAEHSRLKGIPASFVPNRNALFIVLSHSYAQKIGAQVLVTGVCETDFSGYPDCRQVFIDAIQHTLHLSSDTRIEIQTPLMYLDKSQIFSLAEREGVLDEVINLSHTCYNGDRTHKHDWGFGCGECPACKLRERGWLDFIKD